MKFKNNLFLVLILVSSLCGQALAMDQCNEAARIMAAAISVGTVYELARGVSYLKMCPDLVDEVSLRAQKNDKHVFKASPYLGTLIAGAFDGVKTGALVGIPLALASCAGSSPSLNSYDVIKPLSLGFGAAWGAGMLRAGVSYRAAYYDYGYANKVIEQNGIHTCEPRDATDQDELLKCKSARFAAVYGADSFSRVGAYGLAIALPVWALYKRYQL